MTRTTPPRKPIDAADSPRCVATNVASTSRKNTVSTHAKPSPQAQAHNAMIQGRGASGVLLPRRSDCCHFALAQRSPNIRCGTNRWTIGMNHAAMNHTGLSWGVVGSTRRDRAIVWHQAPTPRTIAALRIASSWAPAPTMARGTEVRAAVRATPARTKARPPHPAYRTVVAPRNHDGRSGRGGAKAAVVGSVWLSG